MKQSFGKNRKAGELRTRKGELVMLHDFYVTVQGAAIAGHMAVQVSEPKSAASQPEDEPQLGDYAHKFAHDVEAKLSEDRQTLEVEGWKVQIKQDDRGHVLVVHETDGKPDILPLLLPLNTGTIHLQTLPKRSAHWSEMWPAGTYLYQTYGINRIGKLSPNDNHTGFIANGDGIYTQRAAFDVITDGVAERVLLDDPNHAYDPDNYADLCRYEGKIMHKVAGAKWAIIVTCKASPENGFEQSITLYTVLPNLNLVCPLLDKFLEQHGCCNFADYIIERRQEALGD